ncbi:MAG: DUF805 domain-containing protein [Gammaproteobacteria bacterium AqS3]|nr:DUF805 domain-containing protein [Gammaproteobacteria bacterium AqS3]
MGLAAAVKSTFWTNYFRMQGRASRSEFWWFICIFVAGNAALRMLPFYINMADPSGEMWLISNVALMAFYLYMFPPFVTVLVRRLHDMGKSGWWALWLYVLIPLLCGGISLLLGLRLPTFGLPAEWIYIGLFAVGALAGSMLSGIIELIIGFIKPKATDNPYGPPPETAAAAAAEMETAPQTSKNI